jgi:hypothetical protein
MLIKKKKRGKYLVSLSLTTGISGMIGRVLYLFLVVFQQGACLSAFCFPRDYPWVNELHQWQRSEFPNLDDACVDPSQC